MWAASALGLLWSALPSTGRAAETALSIGLISDPDRTDFGQVVASGVPRVVFEKLEARGVPSSIWASYLPVRVRDHERDDLPAILGTYTTEGEEVRFLPRFPLASGLPIEIRFQGSELARFLGLEAELLPDLILEASLPEFRDRTTARVLSIFPSGSIVPSNLLRLYLHFSEPMRARTVHQSIRLIDEKDGREVQAPFVEFPDGLWDPSGKRLTLLFHPGRIKRGVGPNQDLGPPLIEGHAYRLEILPTLVNAAGEPLAEPYRHSFKAGPDERQLVDLQRWNVVSPSGSHEPLVVQFHRPLDHGMLLRTLTVLSPTGTVVPGRIEVTDQERSWRFEPATPWTVGTYHLQVDSTLEDPAGNTPIHLFDSPVSLMSSPGKTPPPEVHTLSFSVSDHLQD